MLHLKVFYNKNLLKYSIIMLMIFIVLIIFINLMLFIKLYYSEMKNELVYRTIVVEVKNNANFEKLILKYNKDIDNYQMINDNVYEIVFKNCKDISPFIRENTTNFNSTSQSNFDENGNYNTLKNIFNVIIIISVMMLFILIILFSKSIILNSKYDIALYKLIGYENYRIATMFFIMMYILYAVAYLIADLIAYMLILLITKYKIIEEFKFVISSFINNSLNIWLIISLIILLSFVKINMKLKKISPIELMKFSL